MKFLVAPNAFKGSLSAKESASLISSALGEYFPSSSILIQPLADGGDGTCELLIDSLSLEKIPMLSLNPIGQPLMGFFGWDQYAKAAYMDVSTFSGLGMLKDYQKKPDTASTYGTGLAIRKAIELGAEELILGLGGSATIDVGAGILAALGFLFLDAKGREIPLFSPELVFSCKFVQLPNRRENVKFTLLCDVKNKFFGENGAVQIFGPQKGVLKRELEKFELGMGSFVDLLRKRSRKDWQDRPGFGAAGGIALGLDLFFQTEVNYGAAYFFDRVEIHRQLDAVDWIITGEGRYDHQSAEGKACFELLQLAKAKNKKIALITSGKEGHNSGFDLVIELPELNFSDLDFKNKARENLHRLILKAIEGNGFV
jgi:glycerate 2-kinase